MRKIKTWLTAAAIASTLLTPLVAEAQWWGGSPWSGGPQGGGPWGAPGYGYNGYG